MGLCDILDAAAIKAGTIREVGVALVGRAFGWVSWWGATALITGGLIGLGIATLRWRHYQRKVDEWNRSITTKP